MKESSSWLLATMLAVCSIAGGRADATNGSSSADTEWRACENSGDCAWVTGEGGWPTAVRASSAPGYLEWVRSQAPFTTYFMPGDCFEKDEEFDAYVRESRSAVSCVEGQCRLGSDPNCTK